VTRGRDRSVGSGDGVPGLDTTVANPARVWNYWVGGKDNFAADREAAEQVVAVMPSMPLVAKAGRRFPVDAVHELADGQGIRQFLDIGTGLPTAGNTHEIAQQVAPESRVVYVDNDPVVISHARALLTSSPDGKTDFLQADLRDPEAIGRVTLGREDQHGSGDDRGRGEDAEQGGAGARTGGGQHRETRAEGEQAGACQQDFGLAAEQAAGGRARLGDVHGEQVGN
jgi:hypothetical protein